MALYAIGDLHLSFGTNKPMDVFGGAWVGYVEKLRQGLSIIGPEDTTVLLGDVSWAMSLEQGREDFSFLHEIPGKKILLKGNHDYWWSTAAKFQQFCEKYDYMSLSLLHNNCLLYQEVALCGTRGWFFEEERSGTHDEKVFRRELIRLEASLKAAGNGEKLVFLHYPPKYQGYSCPEILELLKKYEVRRCFYGHLHGGSHRLAVQGMWDGIEFRLVSADYLNFHPFKVIS